MRVLHLTRDYPPRCNGGLSTAVGGMVAALRRREVDGSVVSFDGWRPRAGHRGDPAPPREVVDAVPVQRVSNTGHLDAARSFAREQAPDLVHVHHEMLWELAAELGLPAVYTVHVMQSEQNRLRGLPPDHVTMSLEAQRRALAEAALVIAPSRAVAAALAGVGERLRVVGLGVDDDSEALECAFGSRERSGGPILYVGRFADLNGISELFAALPRILEAVPGQRAVVVGGMPDNPKAARKHMRRWHRETRDEIRERVDFTGWLDAAAVRRHYCAASLLLAPSWYETFGQVLLEAMLHALPVVSTTGGAIPELIEDGVTGALVPPRNVDALVSKTVSLLEDPARAAALGAAAGEAARERTWDRVIPDLVAAYCSI